VVPEEPGNLHQQEHWDQDIQSEALDQNGRVVRANGDRRGEIGQENRPARPARPAGSLAERNCFSHVPSCAEQMMGRPKIPAGGTATIGHVSNKGAGNPVHQVVQTPEAQVYQFDMALSRDARWSL
jgi:hypothetical protein